jgi:hypothetical protein
MSRLENWKAQIRAEYSNIPEDVIDWILVVNESNPEYFKKLKKEVEKKQRGRPKKVVANEAVLETVTIKLPEEEPSNQKFKIDNGMISVDWS